MADVEPRLTRISETRTTERPSPGTDSALHFACASIEGTALTHDGELLQLRGFPSVLRQTREIRRLARRS